MDADTEPDGGTLLLDDALALALAEMDADAEPLGPAEAEADPEPEGATDADTLALTLAEPDGPGSRGGVGSMTMIWAPGPSGSRRYWLMSSRGNGKVCSWASDLRISMKPG